MEEGKNKVPSIKIRSDLELDRDINFCCSELNVSKAALFRLGIQKVKDEIIANKKNGKNDIEKIVSIPTSCLPQKEDKETLERIVNLVNNLLKIEDTDI